MSAIPRLTLCCLSIVLLAVLGLLGEELQNLARVVAPSECGPSGAAVWPLPTRLAFELFGQNTGNFLLSLTPFMIGFGISSACARDASRANFFWSSFAAIWLAALIYVGLYCWAMLLPFHTACAELETKPVVWIILTLDVVLVIAGIAAFRRARRGMSP